MVYRIPVNVERYGDKKISVRPVGFLGPSLFEQYREACKTISGVRYDSSAKVQTVPLDLGVCRELRVAFGRDLRIGPELECWARSEVEREKEIIKVQGWSLDGDAIPLPRCATIAPALALAATEGRPYQSVAIGFAARVGNHLNADQPGLGKTIEALGSLVETGVTGDVLVVAPQKSLVATWRREIEKWLGASATVVVAGLDTMSLPKRSALLAETLEAAPSTLLRFVLVNPEMVRVKQDKNADSPAKTRQAIVPELHDHTWSAILADEVHRTLGRANPNSKNVSQFGLGMQLLKCDGLKIAMSGTPMRGKPRSLWATLRWLKPEIYTSQWKWGKRYFVTETNGYTGNDMLTDELRPEMRERFEQELRTIMIRRTKQELHEINPTWAPPVKQYQNVWLEMSHKQAKAYKQMEDASFARLDESFIDAPEMLAQLTRLRQFAGFTMAAGAAPALPSNKFDWLAEFLAERGISKDPADRFGQSKVVVASQFTQFIELIARELGAMGIHTYQITGKTRSAAMTAIMSDWQDNRESETRVLLLNTAAGGVSLTLDAADDLVVMDETWNPDDQEQVEDRIHRTSRTDHQVTIWYVRSIGTIEESIAGENERKDFDQKLIMDGARGVEWVRNMVSASIK
jgi:SNF2 family DNA or RNA helicase